MLWNCLFLVAFINVQIVVIKFGVGTALVVVAYIVLVKKWTGNSDKVVETKTVMTENESECGLSNLSRRNTIVIPPSLEDVQCDIENIEEEFPHDNDESGSDNESILTSSQAHKRYQELRSTYSSMLTPDWTPQHLQHKLIENYEIDEEANVDEEAEFEEDSDDQDDDYDDEISEGEDEELLKRLERKYGKLQHSDNYDEDEMLDEEEDDDNFQSWKRVKTNQNGSESESDHESDGPQATYQFSDITNADDWIIRDEIDHANNTLNYDAAYALTLFNKLLEKNPLSPRTLYGRAQSLDILAEKKRCNDILQEAIETFHNVLKLPKVPDTLFRLAAQRCINRMRFKGKYLQAVSINTLLMKKFPDEINYRNELAVTYLTINKVSEAKSVLQETLNKWPEDGFALAHYGFILKTENDDLETSVLFLQKGISTRASGVVDGRFYFHLGDALTRLGRKEEALAVYEDGVVNGLFLSKYQRSLYNIARLTGKPWWSKKDFSTQTFFDYLEKNWQFIRNEGLKILNKRGYFKPEAENLRNVGEWKQFELYSRGIKNVANCKQCPKTCEILARFPDATTCRRGQIKFSVMHPGTHVWPHCGPTNCRLRIHLGLKIPINTYIRVADEIRSWEEGKLLIFDDSFEHEVWHNGTSVRLVLIIDVWHPEITKSEKQTITSI